MTDEQKEKIIDIAAATFAVPRGEINFTMAPGSIPQWDSLAHLGLISALEEEFGISFDVDELFELETLEDFIPLLEKEGI